MAAWGIEQPEYQVEMKVGRRTFRLDSFFRRIGLDVELDGRTFHQRQKQFQGDRQRDRALLSIGIKVVRYTWHDVRRQALRMETEHRSFPAGP